MRRSLLLFAILLSLSSLQAFAQVGTFSQGMRYGQLFKFSRKGWVLKSWEGEMMVGQDSTYLAHEKCDDKNNCETVVDNPWAFSVADDKPEVIQKLNALQGQYVILIYKQATFAGMKYDTDYMIQDVQLPNPELPVSVCQSANATGKFSNGNRIGRLVKISNKGNFVKSWEAKIQMGTGGNQYVDMSITDPAIVPCLENYLKSGRPVKIQYLQAYVNWGVTQDSEYSIDTVSPLAAPTGGLDN